MQEVPSPARVSVMQEVPSYARVSVMQEVLSHARGSMSNLLQGDLSLEWFMQGDLASHARGSVIKVAEYMTQ